MNSGIPYFPLDVHLDDKFDLIEADFGLKGFAIVVKLFQKIYGGQGYYCEWTKDVASLFAKNINAGGDVVSEIVAASIKRGIFDEELFTEYQILTSKGIQQRYFEAVSRRKKVNVKKEYLLLSVNNLKGNVNILSENVNISSENVNIFEQRKEEKRKEEESNAAADADNQSTHTYLNNNQAFFKFYIEEGMSEELIERIVIDAREQDKSIGLLLSRYYTQGVRTLEDYNRSKDNDE